MRSGVAVSVARATVLVNMKQGFGGKSCNSPHRTAAHATDTRVQAATVLPSHAGL